MFSREDRILSEILVIRGLVTPEKIESCARIRESSEPGSTLVDILVDSGELDRATANGVAAEARDLERALAPALAETRALGEFRLIREIGRGGMGIVYEAEQEPLGRRVALKILPAGAALDERLAVRFMREARAVAKLRHPGIVPVHTVGRAEGALYFAMELVEGQTLAGRIATGPLPPEEAARIAAEVARALAHAHEAGLVHRDIKPANILLGSDGHPRLTDFGLVHEAAAGDFTLSHHVLGTPAYIAPEQALGEPVDARADLYGLGAVLYTMLCGHPPYRGEVPSAVLAKVLAGPPPPVRDRNANVPAALAEICERAMSRRPEDRPASANALACELEAFLGAPRASSSGATARPRRLGAGSAILLASAGLLLVAAVTWTLRGFRHEATERPLEPASLAPTFTLGTRTGGRTVGPSLSPDGEWIAYTNIRDLAEGAFILRLGGGDLTSLNTALGTPTGWATFSRDGKRLALSLDSAVVTAARRIGVLTLEGRQLTRLDAAGSRPIWSPDEREILFTTGNEPLPVNLSGGSSQLWAIDVSSGKKRLVKGMDVLLPDCSPHGKRIAFASRAGGDTLDLWTMTPDGSDVTRVTEDAALDWSPVWSPDGRHLYFGSDRGGSAMLWKIEVDEDSGRPRREAELVAPTALAAPFFLTVSGDGRRLALASSGEPGRVHRFPFDPERGALRDVPTALGRLASFHDAVDPSPDGRSLVLGTSGSRSDILVQGLDDRSEPRSLTSDPARDLAPRWSPDGQRIAFQSDRSGRMDIWTIRPDGTELRQVTFSNERPSRSPVWSPDGATLAFTRDGEGGVLVDVRGEQGAREEVELPPGALGSPFEPSDWSPDGRTLAGEAGGVVLYSLADRTYRRLTDFGEHPVWLPDGRRLLCTSARGLHLLEARDGHASLVYASGPTRFSGVRLARDGRTIFAPLSVSDQEIWLVDLTR